LNTQSDPAPSRERRFTRQPRAENHGRDAAFFATCPRGLEALLAEDIVAVGGQQVAVTPGERFAGSWKPVTA
jgi:hypothetical protein